MRDLLPRVSRCLVSPARRARETAQALGLDGEVAAEIADCDHGDWAGATLREIEARDPGGSAMWLADPASAPHGGETLSEVLDRVRNWLAGVGGSGGKVLAVTHAAVVRAAVVSVLDAPPSAFWKIDVPPLSMTRLSGRDGRWTVSAVSQTFGLRRPSPSPR